MTTHTNSFEDTGQVGVGLRMPLFAGGRLRAKVREEQAALASAQETLRQAELQVRLEVETAILNLSSSLERVRATQKSVEQAAESLRIEQEKYSYGKGAITDVLDAQAALLDTRMNCDQALADFNTAQAQYRLATGEDE